MCVTRAEADELSITMIRRPASIARHPAGHGRAQEEPPATYFLGLGPASFHPACKPERRAIREACAVHKIGLWRPGIR